MKKIKLTKFELLSKVSEFYTNLIPVEKALKMYRAEYDVDVELLPDYSILINTFLINKQKEGIITVDNLIFMKKLQESGKINMFSSVLFIQQALLCSIKDAEILLNFYIKNYDLIYNPETVF